jgi:hypothetical protein
MVFRINFTHSIRGEKIMQSKKTLSILKIAILTISIVLAVVPMAEATTGLSISPNYGVVGTKVTVSGTADAQWNSIKVYWDSPLAANLLNETIVTDPSRVFSLVITVPEATAGAHYIVVREFQDSTVVDTKSVTFTVQPSITLSKVYALPGDSVTVSGTGFAGGKKVNLYLQDGSVNKTLATGVLTSSKGSFSATVIIPTIPVASYGTLYVNATDESKNTVRTSITIDYYILCNPTSGPPGITVNVNGRINAAVSYKVLFGAGTMWVEAFTGISGTNGSFTGTYRIPTTVSAGTYNFKVQWTYAATSYERQSPVYTVTGAPTISLSPTEQSIGKSVTVTGSDFVAKANVIVYLDTMVVATNMTSTTGGFIAKFTVPSVTLGTHKVIAVDQYGATAEAVLTVLPAELIIIKTRSSTYLQGDVVSIYVNCSKSMTGVTLKITDPTGGLFWSDIVDITKTVGWWYTTQKVITTPPLPTDAQTGNWNFTAYDSTNKKIASNLFTVNAKPTAVTSEQLNQAISQMTSQLNQAISQMQSQLNQAITSMASQITSMQSAISGLSSAVNTASSAAQSAASAAQSAASAAQNAASAAQSAASAAQSAASAATAAKTAAESAKSAADSAVSTAQSAVSAANAAKSAADTAASTAESAVSAAESAKAAAEGLAMPVWVAVVLSLISAIAAIFAIITIRGKIAG